MKFWNCSKCGLRYYTPDKQTEMSCMHIVGEDVKWSPCQMIKQVPDKLVGKSAGKAVIDEVALTVDEVKASQEKRIKG